MQYSKFVAVLGLAGCLLGSCSKKAPEPDNTVTRTPITVQVSEAGGPDYALTNAYVESALYDAKINRLSITGKLAGGKEISLVFNRTPNSTAAAYTTDQLTATLAGVTATSASGKSVYSAQTKTVDGTFSATFAGTGTVTGSFIAVPTP